MSEIFEVNKDYPSGLKPFLREVIPAVNFLVVGGKKIGMIQRIDETQERNLTNQYEIGSIGPVEIVPGQPSFSLTLEKIKIYKTNALQILMDKGYNEKFGGTVVKDAIKGQMTGDTSTKDKEVFSLIIHNILPFDIEVWELDYSVDTTGNPVDFTLEPDSKSKVVTKYGNCWVRRYSKPISVGNANVVESMDIMCTKISLK